MSYNEQAFMLDSASEDSYEATEDYGDEGGGDRSDPDTDNKLMEYLLKGFALTSTCCKECTTTPLIKNVSEAEDEAGWFGKKKHGAGMPVIGVPYCVSCCAVVVTTNDELQIMWQNDYKHLMGMQGAVILALDVKQGHTDPLFNAREYAVEAPAVEETEAVVDDYDDSPYVSYQESSNGLLIIAKDDDQDIDDAESALRKQDVDVELDTSPEPQPYSVEPVEKEELNFDIIDYKKR